MAARKWVVGCALGCGAVLLIVIGVLVAGGFWVKDMTRGFDEAVGLRAELEQTYGERDAFVPWPDGVVPADRMQVFLAIRDDCAGPRAGIAELFDALPMSRAKVEALDSQEGLEKAKSVLDVMGSALGLGKQMGAFFHSRNQALLERGMGLGEYSYIYVLSYRGWLEDALDSTDVSALDGGRAGPVLQDDLRRMLAAQLEALAGDADPAWRERLIAEIAALDADPERFPWQGDVPAEIVAGLEPFRERLLLTYEPAADAFELARNTKHGRMSFRVD